MMDESFTGWHVRLRCDAPGHKAIDPTFPDICDDDLFRSRAAYVAHYRAQGWIFHRGEKVTCPDCRPTPTESERQQGDE
jgi:hypothetical protein